MSSLWRIINFEIFFKFIYVSGKIQYEVHSEGLDDLGCTGDSYIIVNGVDYCPHKRGHNIVVLDECGTVVDQRAFDTTKYQEGVSMATYLDAIPDDHVVLIAVQETTGNSWSIFKKIKNFPIHV